MSSIEELEKQREEHIKQRDFHQNKISELWKQLQELKAGDFEKALRLNKWYYLENDRQFFGPDYQRWYLCTHINDGLRYFLEKSGSIQLINNTLISLDSSFGSMNKDRVVIRFYNNDVNDIHEVIKKYNLDVDFTYLTEKKKHIDEVLNGTVKV